MKKLFSLIAILTLFVASVSAQTYVKQYMGRTQDTIRQSTTILAPSINLINSSGVQAFTLQVAADSVSGSPAPKFVLQRSVDNRNWFSVAGDTLTTTVTGGVGTVEKHLTVSPYNYPYARVKIYTSGSAQKSKIWVTIFSTHAD